MKYLRLFSLIFVLTSCSREYRSGRTSIIFMNKSDHLVELEGYYDDSVFEGFSLEQGEEIEFSSGPVKGEDNGPITSTGFEYADSVLIIFDDTLVVQYTYGNEEGNPMQIDNYELVKGEKEPYIYLFEFTNEDYQRALDRGRVIK